MYRETVRNEAKLAEWEDDFDSYVDNWDGENNTYGEKDDNDENLTLNENSSPRCQNEQKRDSQRKLRKREKIVDQALFILKVEGVF